MQVWARDLYVFVYTCEGCCQDNSKKASTTSTKREMRLVNFSNELKDEGKASSSLNQLHRCNFRCEAKI